MSRRAQLEQFLTSQPHDPFLRYGLAMCCASDGDTDAAQVHFQILLKEHPNYVAGYFQFAQMLARLDECEQAKPLLKTGIAVALRTGDSHAAAEMTAFYETL
ncbi:MAG: tetratricopeptide repeat protein [Planctomycetaceae bacterium]